MTRSTDQFAAVHQASDALDECVKRSPERDQAYYSRPATEAQLAYLRPILEAEGAEPDDYAELDAPLSYGRAKDLIRDCEMEKRANDEEEERAYWNSEEAKIDEAWRRIDFGWGATHREVTREEVAKAWALAKSWRQQAQSLPELGDVVGALAELFPDFRPNPNVRTEPNHERLEANLKAMKQELEKRPSEADVKLLATIDVRLNTIKKNSQRNRPTEEQIKSLQGGLKLDRQAEISADKLDELLKLEGLPPRTEDMELFARHGINIYTGDAFAAYGIGDLVRCFENMAAQKRVGFTNVSRACVAATRDPAFQKATITLDQFDRLIFTWPKRKLQEWLRL